MSSVNPREQYPFYVGINKEEETQMLNTLGLDSVKELFEHIGKEHLMNGLDLPSHKSGEELKDHIKEIASKNKKAVNFIGVWKIRGKYLPTQ